MLKDVRRFCRKILWVKRNEKGETYHVEDILEENGVCSVLYAGKL